MAFQKSNLFRVSPPTWVQTYFNKWLNESGGDFVVTHSDYTDRMMVSCKTCGDAHTCKSPIGTEVDYSLQEFVKLHTHKGGHKDEPKQIGGWAAYKSPLEATSVTADFKHVPAHATDLPVKRGGQYQLYQHHPDGSVVAGTSNELNPGNYTIGGINTTDGTIKPPFIQGHGGIGGTIPNLLPYNSFPPPAPVIIYLDKDGNIVPTPTPKIAPPKPMPALKHKTGRKFRP